MQFPVPVPSQKPVPAGAAVFSGNADAAVIVSRGETVITVTNSASAELTALVIKEVLAHA